MVRPIVSILLAAAATLAGAEIPRLAPEFTIIMQGRPVQLSQYKGYICAVAFMSTTCPHCQHLATVLGPIQQEYASKGVQVIGAVFNPSANVDLPAFTHTFAKNLFPIGLASEEKVVAFVQHPPGIHYIPMIVFIDKHGVIRAQHLGIDDAAFFGEAVEVQNIKSELDKIIKQPTVALPAKKK